MRRKKAMGGLTAILALALSAIAVVVLGVSLIDSGPEVLPVRRIDPDDRTPLIVIEGKAITKFHLEVADAYHRLRAGKDGFKLPDYGILLQYMESAACQEILRRHGRGLTPQDVSDERERQVRETRDAKTLREVTALLDQYPGMYEEIYVRPTLANGAIHRLHQDRRVQPEAWDRAEAGLKEALAETDFFFRRMQSDPSAAYFRVDSRKPMEGMNNPQLPAGQIPNQPDLPDQEEGARKKIMEFATRWLSTTTPGGVCPTIVDESDGSFLVVRLLERSPDHVVYEIVAYRKTLYDVWFEGELRKLKGEVVDPATRALLKEKLGNHMYGRWLFGDSR